MPSRLMDRAVSVARDYLVSHHLVLTPYEAPGFDIVAKDEQDPYGPAHVLVRVCCDAPDEGLPDTFALDAHLKEGAITACRRYLEEHRCADGARVDLVRVTLATGRPPRVLRVVREAHLARRGSMLTPCVRTVPEAHLSVPLVR